MPAARFHDLVSNTTLAPLATLMGIFLTPSFLTLTQNSRQKKGRENNTNQLFRMPKYDSRGFTTDVRSPISKPKPRFVVAGDSGPKGLKAFPGNLRRVWKKNFRPYAPAAIKILSGLASAGAGPAEAAIISETSHIFTNLAKGQSFRKALPRAAENLRLLPLLSDDPDTQMALAAAASVSTRLLNKWGGHEPSATSPARWKLQDIQRFRAKRRPVKGQRAPRNFHPGWQSGQTYSFRK